MLVFQNGSYFYIYLDDLHYQILILDDQILDGKNSQFILYISGFAQIFFMDNQSKTQKLETSLPHSSFVTILIALWADYF